MPQELLVWQRSEEFFQDTGLYLKKEPSAYWHRGYRIAAAYAVAAMLLFSIHWMRQKGTAFEDIGVDGHAPPEPETTLPPREAAEVDYERRLKNVALPGSAKAPDTPVG
jgi:hypothetical protein